MTDVLSRKPLHAEPRRWQCPRCTAYNSGTDMDCRTCLNSRPGRPQLNSHLREEQSQLPEEGPVKKSFVENVKSFVLGKPAPWRCPRCTCEMGGSYTKCSACGYLRTDSRRRSDAGGTSVFSDLFKFTRRYPRPQQASSVDLGGDGGYPEGSGWSCPQCTFRNLERAQACKVCDWKRTISHQVSSIADESFEVINGHDESLRDVIPGGSHSSFTVTEDGSLSHTRVSTDAPHFNSMSESSVLVLPTSPKHTSLPSPSTPKPHPDPAPPSSLDDQRRPHTAVVSVAQTRSWRCSVCGAFNLIFAHNQKCFVCGIGLIPNDDIAAANNRTRTHPYPESLVVPSNRVPKREGYGQLVYTNHPSAAVVPHHPVIDDRGQVIGSSNGGGHVAPQRPSTLDVKVKRDQSPATGRRRRNSSIRRSAEDSLGTPARSATVLLRVVKHHYEMEADRTYREICQYCNTVSE